MVLIISLPNPTHSAAFFLYSLHLFNHYEPVGRYKLSQELCISSAKTRIILEKLVDAKLVEVLNRRRGHQLSSHGKEVWQRYQNFLHIPTQRIHLGRDYTLGKKDAVVCVNGSGIKRLNTVVLRDESLMNGALGCTVFLKDQSEQFFLLDTIYPPLPKVSLSDRKVRKRLSSVSMDILWPKIIIIVGTADHIINAQIGAISAALLLLPEDISQFFHKIMQ